MKTAFLICSSVKWGPNGVPGCITEPCDECGQLVYVAPSSQERRAQTVDTHVVVIMCEDCGCDHMAAQEQRTGKPVTIGDLTPRQLEELEALLLGKVN